MPPMKAPPVCPDEGADPGDGEDVVTPVPDPHPVTEIDGFSPSDTSARSKRAASISYS